MVSIPNDIIIIDNRKIHTIVYLILTLVSQLSIVVSSNRFVAVSE